MNKKKNPNSKNFHDYVYIYGSLGLNLCMVIATVFIAYSAYIKIPEQIKESSSASYFDWQPINYKEQLMFIDAAYISDNPNEILIECDKLLEGSEKTLQSYFK